MIAQGVSMSKPALHGVAGPCWGGARILCMNKRQWHWVTLALFDIYFRHTTVHVVCLK